MLSAPFAYRTYYNSGYAGDYEMVNMITRDPQKAVPSLRKL